MPPERKFVHHGQDKSESIPLKKVSCTLEIMDIDGDAMDDVTSPLLPMQLFEMDDSLDSVRGRVVLIYKTLVKDYERYLLIKYVCLSEEERKRQSRENTVDNQELRDFNAVWHLVTRDRSVPLYESYYIHPNTEEYQMFKKYQFLFWFVEMNGTLTDDEKEAFWKLTDEQRDFLNQLIVTKHISSADPGHLYTSSHPLSEEDKEFINQLIKGKDIKVPWSQE